MVFIVVVQSSAEDEARSTERSMLLIGNLFSRQGLAPAVNRTSNFLPSAFQRTADSRPQP